MKSSFYLLGSFGIAILASCSTDSKESLDTISCIPALEISSNKDTLDIGEKYIVNISLSDTSLFFFKDGDKTVRYLPRVLLNGSQLNVNQDGSTFFEFNISPPEIDATLIDIFMETIQTV